MKKHSIDHKSFPASAIIEGGTKESRKQAAFETATKLFCVTGVGCGTCNQCVKIKAGSHPDFFYIDASTLGVKYTREEIVRAAYTKPSEAEFKIFIFENADSISVPVQNTLLKAIEEPQNAYFVFLCHNHRALLQTINSRCQVFALPSENDEIANKAVADMASGFASAFANELALCEYFVKASDLARNIFPDFIFMCKQETYKLILSQPQKRGQFLMIYDYFDKLLEQLVYNPNLFSLTLSAAAEIWEIYNKDI